ncbi:hypothetical protein WICMUC_005916 [Wickerhamomyces mucosus]|uniref:Uncharacterized protein n=1 Tax=Wickerhamomyces mucosus TaxID=1378264 RepID=A0A9P8P290_9ASCO|nr:hypothetical protein WICMUC_005916 [Wickerhamomyces mucosus]
MEKDNLGIISTEHPVNSLDGSRTKRWRDPNVDYTEKVEDFDDQPKAKGNKLEQKSKRRKENKEVKSTQAIKSNSESTQTSTPQKRKYTRKTDKPQPNSTNGTTKSSNSSRSETPNSEEDFPMNFIPDIKNSKFSNILNLDGAVIKNGLTLQCKNGFKLNKGDNIYLICEPPGEPYYIGRIMKFVKKNHKETDQLTIVTTGKTVLESADDYKFKINWYYRARDISKHSADSRLLYCSMHSDTCPLQSFRGECQVLHKDEISDLDAFKMKPNQFWFDQLYDRYMIKFYDILPTAQLTTLPSNYFKALTKRFQYIFVERGKNKEILQSPKSCVKCNQWCNTNDSIQCCECEELYHMLCLDPPLLRKPARGFAWTCINCTKRIEGNKEFKNSDLIKPTPYGNGNQNVKSSKELAPVKMPHHEELAIKFNEKDSIYTTKQRRDQEEWVYRYLGIHAKLEDALDLQDRPYPRAVSSLGPKNQWTGAQDWFGHKVQYYNNSSLPEKYQKATISSGKKKKSDSKKAKKQKSTDDEDLENQRILEVPGEYKNLSPSEFPPWLQERPKGYIERGGDDTVELKWKTPEVEAITFKVDEYIKNQAYIAERLGLLPNTPNFVDCILGNLLKTNYNFEKASKLNDALTRETLKEPTFSEKEIKIFEEGVRKYGSELFPVQQEVKTQTIAMVVRYYYLWKKTKNGHAIWDNFDGRKKNRNKQTDEDDADAEVANTADDSSYDIEKSHNRSFQCKHCKTMESTQWFRSPGPQHSDIDKSTINALCIRCARLWRRYAIEWEAPNEILKRINQKGGNGWRRKVEQELVDDAELIISARTEYLSKPTNIVKKKRQASETPELADAIDKKMDPKLKKMLKKSKTSNEIEEIDQETFTPPKEILVSNVINDSQQYNLHKAINEKYYQSTSCSYNSRLKFYDHSDILAQKSSRFIPSKPWSDNCAVCQDSGIENKSLQCYVCNVVVHPLCFGVEVDDVNGDFRAFKWCCDTCSNSLNPIASTVYNCCICKSDHPYGLKRTENGNWAHIICSLLRHEVKFGDTTALQPVLGVEEFSASCLLDGKDLAHKNCETCSKNIHYSDLYTGDYRLGFKIDEVSKMDVKCVRIGNIFGKLSIVLQCREHPSLDNYVPLNADVRRYKQSGFFKALYVFIEDHKRPSATYLSKSGAEYRNEIFRRCFSTLHNNSRDSYIIEEDSKEHTEVIKTEENLGECCSVCSTTITMRWFRCEHEGNNTATLLCYKCHLDKSQIQSTVDLAPKKEDDEQTGPAAVCEKLIDISHSNLNGSLYGIATNVDKLVKPEITFEDYSFSPTMFESIIHEVPKPKKEKKPKRPKLSASDNETSNKTLTDSTSPQNSVLPILGRFNNTSQPLNSQKFSQTASVPSSSAIHSITVNHKYPEPFTDQSKGEDPGSLDSQTSESLPNPYPRPQPFVNFPSKEPQDPRNSFLSNDGNIAQKLPGHLPISIHQFQPQEPLPPFVLPNIHQAKALNLPSHEQHREKKDEQKYKKSHKMSINNILG